MITCLRHNAPNGGGDRVLLVMLPGVGIAAHEFADRGMVAAVHERGLPVDVIAAHPALDLYLDGAVDGVLHRSVIAPALAQGYKRLWFLGISLGGMGALLYTSAHAAHVEGVVLLAPFLGTQGTVAELAEVGGLASQSALGSATAPEKRMLDWLRDFLARRPVAPMLYLGYGRGDRFSQGHRLLDDQLPRERVVTTGGGHDWETWLALWQRMLDVVPLTTKGGSVR